MKTEAITQHISDTSLSSTAAFSQTRSQYCHPLYLSYTFIIKKTYVSKVHWIRFLNISWENGEGTDHLLWLTENCTSQVPHVFWGPLSQLAALSLTCLPRPLSFSFLCLKAAAHTQPALKRTLPPTGGPPYCMQLSWQGWTRAHFAPDALIGAYLVVTKHSLKLP